MSSTAQILANQANSRLSTGPRTEAGKSASALNNLQHGARSEAVLLPGEDPAEYEALLAELTTHFTAVDATELRSVREMADADWRLQRIRRCSSDALTRRIAELTEHLLQERVSIKAKISQFNRHPRNAPALLKRDG